MFPRSIAPCRALLLVGLAFLPALTGCGTKMQNTLKVQDTLSEALRHAQVDPDDKQAREWTDRAVAVAPNDPTTYLGDPNPNAPGPVLSIAAVFASVGDDPALADYMQQAAGKFPDDYRAYQILIDSQGRLGRTAERQANAAKLVALLTKKMVQPGAQKIPLLIEALAQAYWAEGDTANGTAEYKKAITSFPSLSSYRIKGEQIDLGPYNGLAYAEAVANVNLPEALGLAQKALTLENKDTGDDKDENVASVQDTLGWVQYRMGTYKEAEQNLQQAASAQPRLAEIRYHLGMVYAAEGKTDAARAELGHALLLSQGYAEAKQALDRLPKAGAPPS